MSECPGCPYDDDGMDCHAPKGFHCPESAFGPHDDDSSGILGGYTPRQVQGAISPPDGGTAVYMGPVVPTVSCQDCSYRTLEPFLALKAYFEANEALRVASERQATVAGIWEFQDAQLQVKEFTQALEDARQEYLKLTK